MSHKFIGFFWVPVRKNHKLIKGFKLIFKIVNSHITSLLCLLHWPFEKFKVSAFRFMLFMLLK